VNEKDLIAQAHRDFERYKTAWEPMRADYNSDLRATWIEAWDPNVKSARENSDERKPALNFGRLHTLVQAITNRARLQRPQPKIEPQDGQATVEIAEKIEGRWRQIQYESQADVAYDTGVDYATSGGFGFWRIDKAFINEGLEDDDDPRIFEVEPRIIPVQDPAQHYPDPDCLLPDFSDAKGWFVRKRYLREEFEMEFGQEPMGWDGDTKSLWQDKEHVWAAEWWRVFSSDREKVRLDDGTVAWWDQLPKDFDRRRITHSRGIPQRQVVKRIIDGEKVLETEDWEGSWIPIIPVLGGTKVIEGRKVYLSAIRFSKDPQKLLNIAQSTTAELLGSADWATWVGWKGSFKDGRWREPGRKRYYEADKPIEGLPPELPRRDIYEPPIQSLSAASMQYQDAIRAGCGYVDSILQPSKAANLSGVAVDRREQQQDATNAHFLDNLTRAQWHSTRVGLELLLKWTDTPRKWKVRDAAGKMADAFVSTEEGATVEGHENQTHHRIDIGRYGVVIVEGQDKATQRDEEKDFLLEVFKANPMLCLQLFGDIFFEKLGYEDLAKRATYGLAPAIQQAMQSEEQGISPREQQQAAQIQQLRQILQQLGMKLAAKQVEQQGRLAVENTRQRGEITRERLKLISQLMGTQQEHQHQHHEMMAEHRMDAIGAILDFLKDVELSPDPNAPMMPGQPGAAAPPQPNGAIAP
jgi:hypothetical protein